MAQNVYECMFLLDTGLVGGDEASIVAQLHEMIQKHGGEILVSRRWDERRLAYRIRNQKTGQYQRKGLYYLIYFRSDSLAVAPMQRDFRLSDFILRTLVLKVDPKLVDSMLAAAQGEGAMVALQTYQDDRVVTTNLPAPAPATTAPSGEAPADSSETTETSDS